ncbi:MAG TPA: PIN domain-containing protein, partial [Pseudomonas sp.]|nr:PIN domain-containing protein [Pseudomonas sp.]
FRVLSVSKTCVGALSGTDEPRYRMRNNQGWLIEVWMRTNYVLVDYENLQIQSLGLLQEPHFRLFMFLGPNNTKLPTELVVAVQRLRERAEYVQLDTPGHNALDFHVTFYLGMLTAKDPSGYFHVISRDKGFDSLIKHLKAKGISAARSELIEELPCFKPSGAPVTNIPAAAIKAATPTQNAQVDDLIIRQVVTDLVARKASKPRTVKTLMSTIHAKIGKAKPITDVENVYNTLQKRGYVRENGTKVTYQLPSGA